MTFRPALDADIPAIVSLLRLSLGETLMPKSEAFWRWKHIDNPFGPSPVLLAEDNDTLVGVRAFLRWEWSLNGAVIKAVRAVDTATHPDFQGQGIFKKLTLLSVERCQQEGVQFIFNTPNASSMPGYLKMGWHVHGRMAISAFPVLPRFKKSKPSSALYAGEAAAMELPPARPGMLITHTSKAFLAWRYGRNPNERYYELQADTNRIIFRIKPGKRFTEMRIVEGFYTGKQGRSFFSLIQQEAHALGAQVITWAGFKLPFVSIPFSVGPVITLNTLGEDQRELFKHWRPTLGDMEVF
jgi:GNAT superfamily N-acetyltransferase